MKKLIYLFAILFSLSASAQEETFLLKIKFTSVRSSDGKIAVAVYNSKEDYMVTGKEYFAIRVKAQEGETYLEISLPKGEYAISVFHDENDDQKLNTNFMGIPKEDYGFSNNPNSTFGPPKFEKAVFTLANDLEIDIKLN